MLWFDVGYIRDTTDYKITSKYFQLWFDVGYIRDTTVNHYFVLINCCGLMQDI